MNKYKRLKALAESQNAYDFVFIHHILAILLYRAIGIDEALKVFEAISKESKNHGIHGLTRVCGSGFKKQYLARLGISTLWEEWDVL